METVTGILIAGVAMNVVAAFSSIAAMFWASSRPGWKKSNLRTVWKAGYDMLMAASLTGTAAVLAGMVTGWTPSNDRYLLLQSLCFLFFLMALVMSSFVYCSRWNIEKIIKSIFISGEGPTSDRPRRETRTGAKHEENPPW